MKRIVWISLGLACIGLAIQLVPYGRSTTNPAVIAEPKWDSDQTRELFFRACTDCHSNETEWPWYARIAPASWLMKWDVEEARSHFNVSEWGRKGNHGDEAAELVRKGDMPLWYYLPAHPEAQLTSAETARLVAGLERTFGTPEGKRSGHAEDSARPSDSHDHDPHSH